MYNLVLFSFFLSKRIQFSNYIAQIDKSIYRIVYVLNLVLFSTNITNHDYYSFYILNSGNFFPEVTVNQNFLWNF